MLGLSIPRFLRGSWGDLARGLVLFGLPTAALVSLCGLAVWKLRARRQLQQRRQVTQNLTRPSATSSLDPGCSQQHSSPTAVPLMSNSIAEVGKDVKGGGGEHPFTDSGYMDSTSFFSTSTPLPPNQLFEGLKSPEGRFSMPESLPQQQPPLPHHSAIQATSLNPAAPGPAYSSAPVDLRAPRSRATIQLPIEVVGRFIGRQGRNIKSLMAESGSQIHVQQKNLSRDATMVPCVLQGTSGQITKAIDLILLRHPEVVIPPVSSVFSQLPPSPISTLNGPPASANMNGGSSGTPLAPAAPKPAPEVSWDFELKPPIIPGSSFLAIATYIEKLNQIWLVPYSSTQQLDELHQAMTQAYSKGGKDCQAQPAHAPTSSSSSLSQPPLLDAPAVTASTKSDIQLEEVVGKYCAVRVSEIYWLRGRVSALRQDEGTDYEVKLMDYGSSVIVPPHALKPLRYLVYTEQHCPFSATVSQSVVADICSFVMLIWPPAPFPG